MRHRATLQSQRARRALSQEAMKRSHRRCDLIRLTPEDESGISTPRSTDEVEQTDEPMAVVPHS
ncbi:MAG TPA: hypothetical protein PKY50_13900 [Candidatus Competibacter sp.]|nr:hypothetical protein [Candidatus Competibacter sp.]